jgi:hypothetical protein
MYLNDKELQFYYEMKKEEMTKEISTNRYSVNNKTPFYQGFLHVLQHIHSRKNSGAPKVNCCSYKVCCES